MDQQKKTNRGIDIKMQKMWVEAIAKEDKLRLNWFRNNEPRLEAIIDKENIRKVPKELVEENTKAILDTYQNVTRHAVPPFQEIPPFVVEERALYHVMRPVDPEVTKLLHCGTDKNGRVKYLHERYKIIPEQRFYFPETTSFTYGWNMWNHSLNNRMSCFGRRQVIKESFYRRRGVEKDPDWYREPAKLSPNVCGCI